MRLPLLVKLIPVLGLVWTATTVSQSTESIPQCWQDCVKSSNLSCKDTDWNCICSSAPSHLSSFLACVASKCPAASASLVSLSNDCRRSSSSIRSIESITTDVAHPTLLLASSTSLTVISTSTITSSVVSATATGKSDDGGGQGGDGTILNLEGGGGKREGGCLLGLTVGILAGIAWF